ncbi:hypothetical protein BDP81DRAFT_194051 [Colletotrichum phormii]|uniref:Uncharacterized protein n=1 Tax=Colletotrichum phormii TaxID=359342 RepID=A0AAI9ZYN4_9PEZI|nr:uncharacterized protein BDP81DRAFT_194051 [Colletotrichum phormii]KAK1638957.1 hypothetical protein BDP81DRAFT_194051 [Colletotrichum phormii]
MQRNNKDCLLNEIICHLSLSLSLCMEMAPRNASVARPSESDPPIRLRASGMRYPIQQRKADGMVHTNTVTKARQIQGYVSRVVKHHRHPNPQCLYPCMPYAVCRRRSTISTLCGLSYRVDPFPNPPPPNFKVWTQIDGTENNMNHSSPPRSSAMTPSLSLSRYRGLHKNQTTKCRFSSTMAN